LNAIVNAQGIWPLEFTCRFGYPGFAILTPLQKTPWGELLRAMITRSQSTFETRAGFSVGVVLTTPPFPYARPQVEEPSGLPVIFDGDLTAEDRGNLHYCELGLEAGQLVTTGIYGWAMVVTGVADTIAGAQQRANRLADRVLIPNVRYRRDIGARLIGGEYAHVESLDLLDPA
jgi:phosphoribosylamine--glycine ligase